MIGIAAENTGAKVLSAMEKGLLVNKCTDSVIRMLPSLVIGKKECDLALQILGEVL